MEKCKMVCVSDTTYSYIWADNQKREIYIYIHIQGPAK